MESRTNIKTIHAERGKPLCIGREGENNARQVVFDVSHWRSVYGPGTVQLIVLRTGETVPYPAALTVNGNRAFWMITAADTAIPGSMGKAELRYMVNDTLAKSEKWTTVVVDALGEPSEKPPEPQKAWVNQALQAGADAQNAAAQAKADAEETARIVAEMDKLAAQVGQDAETAAKAKEDALAAKGKAETAQRAAETAQKAAGDAAGKAGTDASAASAAATRAKNAASDAAAALADLQTLHQQMQEYAAQSIQAIQTEGDTQVDRVAAEGEAQTAAAKAEADRAELAASRQPYPNAETGTWFVWDVETGAYVDTGISCVGSGSAGPGVSAGGTPGQVLTKKSETDYDAEWQDAPTEIFTAIYGETTLTEILEAFSAGKKGVCINGLYSADMVFVSAFAAYFYSAFADGKMRIYTCASDGWTATTYTTERTANKVTAISADSTDTQYPSAKAVYDALAAKSGTLYGTCETDALTAEKVVEIAGFTLHTGVHVSIRFANYNHAASPTLNINGTGAIAITKYDTTAVNTYMWTSGAVVEFVYDGTYWIMVGGTTATTVYYGLTKLSSSVSSTSNSAAATPGAVKKAYDLAAAAVPAPTTAQVGQTIAVKAVDENGKPTEWEAVDAKPWKLLRSITLPDDPSQDQSGVEWVMCAAEGYTDQIAQFWFDTDDNGNQFSVREIFVNMKTGYARNGNYFGMSDGNGALGYGNLVCNNTTLSKSSLTEFAVYVRTVGTASHSLISINSNYSGSIVGNLLTRKDEPIAKIGYGTFGDNCILPGSTFEFWGR